MDHKQDSQLTDPPHEKEACLTIKASCQNGSHGDHTPGSTDPQSHDCEGCPNLKGSLMEQTLKEVFGI
ncbi:MAG: hypothetical protein JKX85_10300 [Phycisphaeraceae bacterium]|nr:hypothetical protein [Phycisphaeraceae bacterium]